MDNSVDTGELAPELRAKLQLWEAVCRDTRIEKDADFYEALANIEEAMRSGKTKAVEASINLALEHLTSLTGVSLPTQAVGNITDEMMLDLHVRADAFQVNTTNHSRLNDTLERLNTTSIQQGKGPLPGCDPIPGGEYMCSIDPDAPAGTYSQDLLDMDAARREAGSILNDRKNKERFSDADEMLVQEVLNGNVAIIRQEDNGICKAYGMLKESGVLPYIEQANIRFIEATQQEARVSGLHAASGKDGYGYSIFPRDGALRLAFTGNSEEKLGMWPALVEAYNLKHPEQTPVMFTRESAGVYMAQASTETITDLAQYLHRSLRTLLGAPEQSLPRMAETTPDITRGK